MSSLTKFGEKIQVRTESIIAVSLLRTLLDTLPHHIVIPEIEHSLDLDAETTLIG